MTFPSPDHDERDTREWTPMFAALKAGNRVRGGFPYWLKGAPTHVLAEFLNELEADGWLVVPSSERVRADRAEALLEEAREALRVADVALRRHTVTWVALSGRLDTPYSDDPRWSPWTRFAKRACERGDRARKGIRVVLSRLEKPDTQGEDT